MSDDREPPGAAEASAPINAADLPTSDDMLRLIFESATDYAIFTTDVQGRVTSWNVGAERMLGYSAEEVLGRSSATIFVPEDRAAGAPHDEFKEAAASGRAEDERWHLRKDGSRFWASGLLLPLVDRNRGFVKILRDRTERHRAETLVAENEARFRLLATSIPQLVFRTRPDGMRTWASPQWIDFSGLSSPESLGEGWLNAIHPDDREATRAGWPAAQRTGEYYAEHRVRRQRDGAWRWHQTRARPIAGGEQGDWVGTMTDVHDLHELHDMQRMLMGELQHRTRNLLAVTQAIADQTLRRSESLDSFRTEFRGRLRALSRVQSLIAGSDDQEVQLGDLVGAEMRAHNSEEARVRIAGPAVGLPPNAGQALGLALHELATNAVKYGALSARGGQLEVTWKVLASADGPRVELRWIESGVPMPPDTGTRRTGYGTELIRRALPYQLGTESDLVFAPDGVRWTIIVPLQGATGEKVGG